ncbi:MAG: ribbon-helix-helix protein, CopG family [Lentisphaerota bacterium]
MHRTQIYLDDEIYHFLEKEKKRTHQSYSEIIRLNIKQNIKNKYSVILNRMEKASGSWKNQDESPEEYVEKMRTDRSL